MPVTDFVSILLWGLTLGSLLVYAVLSGVIYYNNKEKAFRYYSLYCLLLGFYIFFRMDMPPFLEHLFNVYYTESFNWYIQILFYLTYFSFALYFLDLDKMAPRIFWLIRRYQGIMLAVSTVLFLLCSFGVTPQSSYTSFFTFFFVPVQLIVSGIIIYQAFKSKSFAKHYFLVANIFYVGLAMTAFIYSMLRIHPMGYDPIDFFFLAVILENIVFAYAMGRKVQEDYRDRYRLQKKLHIAESGLKEQLKNQLSLKEVENQFLLESNKRHAMEAQIASLQTKVLRNQMNSHFVFNVLNSIKAFIIENEKDNAILYLSRFSKFIRKILDGSIYEQSNLKEELETAQLYISIENMRFNNEIDFLLDVDPSVQLESIPFPPLLMQPFIENAIWHGLSNVKGEKKLGISLFRSNNSIIVEVQDNGIGYLANVGRPEGHQSKGIKILEERIREFNAQNDYKISYNIQDESLLGINRRGTCVRIEISKTGIGEASLASVHARSH